MNTLLWRLPLPHRVLARLSAALYHSPQMPGDLVLRVIDALSAAEVPAWVGGGWGLDALAGRQTRAHIDVDLVIDERRREDGVGALEAIGFAPWYEMNSDRPLEARIVLQDHPVAGHAVDLHPVDLAAGHVELATGTIDGRTVPCLALRSQLATHGNYRNANYWKRRRDNADTDVLDELADRDRFSASVSTISGHRV